MPDFIQLYIALQVLVGLPVLEVALSQKKKAKYERLLAEEKARRKAHEKSADRF